MGKKESKSKAENQDIKSGKSRIKTHIDFVDLQLASSGLTFDDVKAKIFKSDDYKTILETATFERGSLDQYGRRTDGDDMVIRYFDLEGKEDTYRDLKGKDQVFFRIRWANPDLHCDRHGRPMKYRSPAGSGNHIYIPQKIRTMYEFSRPFDRLYIAEGEKKAEKMCKHGLLALGIPGITALADKNKRLPESVQKLVRRCCVKEVCFLLDSDLFDIPKSIEPDKDILQRPRSFYYAVKNYKEYFRTFYNFGINIQIMFGYVKPETGEKGIDDLLVNKLKGAENLLTGEIDRLVNEKDMNGSYLRMHRISTLTDQQLEALWEYNDQEKFATKHKDILKNLPFFTMWRHKWRFNEDGIFESAQPLEDDEKYWDEQRYETKTGQQGVKYTFHYGRCFNFLRNRGFGRLKLINGGWGFARIDGRIVAMQDPYEIRDYVISFTKAIKMADVLELLYRGGVQYLGPDRLSNLEFIDPEMEKSSKHRQVFYFTNKIWEVNKDGIQEHSLTEIDSYIWNENIKHFDAKKTTSPLVEFTKITEEALARFPQESSDYLRPYIGRYLMDYSEDGEKCHFLKFLENASNFTWRKNDNEVTPAERFENIEHLLAKLTALGYMLHTYKDPGICKAIVAMDGKLSEVGASNGRSGKSLLGKAVGCIVNQVYIGGKSKNLTEDNFLYNDVTDKTKNIFIDDVRANLDFEHFFPLITGDLSVNVKSGGRFIIPFSDTPKLLVTTNHAINGEGSSFADRQWIIAFSDYYNDSHKPIDDFGVNFFSEWGYEQWNLFYNLCANAVYLYLKFGVIESPNENVELRKLRQDMGEDFVMWADEYFSEGGSKINQRIPRKEMYDDFVKTFPNQMKFCNQTSFKKKIKAFCRFRSFVFNKNLYDDKNIPLNYDPRTGMPILDDKSGGVEYFTLGDDKFIHTPKRR